MLLTSLGVGLSLISMTMTAPSFNTNSISDDTNVILMSENSNVVDIGKFAIMESVTETTKVIVSNSNVAFVKSLGIILSQEEDPGIVFPPVGPGLIKAISPTTYRYYYYATPDGLDKITDIVMLDNTLDSLLIMLEYLEELAAEQDIDAAEEEILNNVIGYIRSINNSYVGNNWEYLTGAIDTDLIDYINNLKITRGIKPNEYFGAFLPTSLYNSSLHPTMRTNYENHGLSFVDPINPNRKIDLIHMFASIDACLDDTSSHFYYKVTVDSQRPNFFKDLGSWGGDLQQAAKYYRNEVLPADLNFESVMSNPSSGATEDDIFADIDAYNIYFNCIVALKTPIISDAIHFYYYSCNSDQIRFQSFLNNLKNSWDQPSEYFTNAQLRIYYNLAIVPYGSELGNLLIATYVQKKVFSLIMEGDKLIPIFNRLTLAYSFYSYILRMTQNA